MAKDPGCCGPDYFPKVICFFNILFLVSSKRNNFNLHSIVSKYVPGRNIPNSNNLNSTLPISDITYQTVNNIPFIPNIYSPSMKKLYHTGNSAWKISFTVLRPWFMRPFAMDFSWSSQSLFSGHSQLYLPIDCFANSGHSLSHFCQCNDRFT